MYKKRYLFLLLTFLVSATQARTPLISQNDTTEQKVIKKEKEVFYLDSYVEKSGDAKEQYKLALMYDTGVGAPQDSQKALKWYEKAARQGHNEAQNRVAVMYERGEGIRQDYEQAIYWYKESVKQGNAFAKHRLDLIYSTHKGQRIAQREQEDLLNRQASTKENINTQFMLALAHFQGMNVTQDHEKNYEWCIQEDIPSQNYLSQTMTTGSRVIPESEAVFD